MRYISLASSSKGNAAYLETACGGWLIDCGISMRRIEQGLAAIPQALDRLQGIFITHEHRDHVAGLGPFLRRYRLPCYAGEGTWRALLSDGGLGKVDRQLVECLPFREQTLGGLTVTPLALSHDAAEPFGFSFAEKGLRLTHVTDTGRADEVMAAYLTASDLVVVEANHDVNLLEKGPYPYYLKQRILGARGHLSNAAAAKLLVDSLEDRTRTVVLAHLSDTNNRPALAEEAVKTALDQAGLAPQILLAGAGSVDVTL